MGRESVNAKHEFLELWAILERQKVWLSLSSKVHTEQLSEREVQRRRACISFLDLHDLQPWELKEVRDTIAHCDPSVDLLDISVHSTILRRLNEIILGYERFERLWNHQQSEWSQEKFATRRQRQNLLRRWEDLFDGLFDYWDLMPSQRDSITEQDFERSKKARHSSSHPNPPPSAEEVTEVMAIFRGYSTKLRQKKKSDEKIAARREAEILSVKAEAARRQAEEANRIEREHLAKKKEEAARAERLRRQEDGKRARQSAKSLRREQKARTALERENFRRWSTNFHEESINAAHNKERLTEAQRRHLRSSRMHSYVAVVWALLLTSITGLLLVLMSFLFPPLFLLSWIFFLVYLFGHLLVNLGIPTWIIVCIYAAPVVLISEYIHEKYGARYVTAETKLEVEKKNQST